jgi:hypothetical protein
VNAANLQWRKSTFSTAAGNCVEVALAVEAVAVRDSKNTSGPTLAFPASSWDAFRRQAEKIM